MVEDELAMEKRLIEMLSEKESQWTYCPELKTEVDLWGNFRSILETNNQDVLNGVPLSDTEFLRIKNQVVSASFYDAGVKLNGENGQFHVHITRANRDITLTVFNRYHKTGGSTVYQIIDQFSSFATTGGYKDRRFDMSFLFNGIPLIHIELKNGRHTSYLDAFRQIQTYINEGHFKGVFSLVQMFVISNGVQTKYIAANEVLNKEFLTSWTEENNPDVPVADLFAFAKQVLRIPQAHEMVTDYCQLDATNQRLMLLRPYQIQAIQAMREAYMQQKSGFIWHATGSGKTLTSYKASRNLLLDMPGIDKTVFLIDRKDLDEKTCRDFDSYAESDTVDVVGTENTTTLENKLLGDKREMIVTTIQKLQGLIRKYNDPSCDVKKKEKLKSKRIAFVVDECHRTVTNQTRVIIDGFFLHRLWYGFTGTPIFEENQGDLGAITEQMYGKPLHCYTIKNALHDKAVLGFQVERFGYKGLRDDGNGHEINEDFHYYETDRHKLSVIDIIVNKSIAKFGIDANPFGKTYEGLLTTGSIPQAQRYYELFQAVKKGKSTVKIDRSILEKYPDFPKVAITYSITENKPGSEINKEKFKQAMNDYNHMFGTSYTLENIDGYTSDLTMRFARKEGRFLSRNQQLDLVIVADRLLTGFDAPCLSSLFMDRQPTTMHKIIQAFSRTNRIFDKNKTMGYIMTFQSPARYKRVIDDAIRLFSKGGTGDVIAPPFADTEKMLVDAIRKLRVIASGPDMCKSLETDEQKNAFCHAFQQLDTALTKVRTYMEWNQKDLERDYHLSKDEYYAYAGWYHNFMDERKGEDGESEPAPGSEPDIDYELHVYGKENIDYLYVVRLIQDYIKTGDTAVGDIEKSIDLISQHSPRLGEELQKLWVNVKEYPDEYKEKDLTTLFEEMKKKTLYDVLEAVSEEYCLHEDDVKYAAYCYQSSQEEIPNFEMIRKDADPVAYGEKVGEKINRLQYYIRLKAELKQIFDEYVLPFKEIN